MTTVQIPSPTLPRAPHARAVRLCVAVVAALTLTGCSRTHTPSATSASALPPASSSGAPSAATSAATVATSPAVTQPAVASPLTSNTPASTTSATPPTQATTPALTAVPSGFTPISVTFVSSQTGFVLGQLPCAATSCYGLAKTVDAGHSWSFVADLPMAVAHDNPPISTVRFADPSDGWAFGPQLWSTHDGGASWHQLAAPARAFDVEASGGLVYVLGSSCANDPCANPAVLARADVGSDALATVAGVPALGDGGRLALHAKAVWIITQAPSGSHYVSSPDGVSWTNHANPCPQGGDPSSVSDIAPVTTSTLFLLCVGDPGAGSETKVVLSSTDGGATTHVTAAAPGHGGLSADLAAASASVVAVSAQSGATWIYRSADAGATWATPFDKGDGGMGLTDLGFTTPTQGVAIYGSPVEGSSQLLMTRDAGATWAAVAF